VAPGLIASSGLDNYPDVAQQFIQDVVKDIPFKRMGTESETAAAIVFLLSPAASYISGESIRIDGASSLWRKTWEIEEHSKAPKPYDGFM
jgi:citronellol/citronellal dehydrogenase